MCLFFCFFCQTPEKKQANDQKNRKRKGDIYDSNSQGESSLLSVRAPDKNSSLFLEMFSLPGFQCHRSFAFDSKYTWIQTVFR